MSLFSTLLSKIFSHASTPVASNNPPASAAPAASATAAGTTATGAPASTSATSPAPSMASAPAPAPAQEVDVAAVMDGLAAKNSEQLDWKKSIVDLMKLVGMDSSLSARKELATELKYTGDMNDSAAMNVWLHKEVLQKISENGGKVPADLLAK